MARKKAEETVETVEKTVDNTNTEPEMEEAVIPENEETEDLADEDEVTKDNFVKGEMPNEKSTVTDEDAESFQKESNDMADFLRRSITLPGRRKQRATFREEEHIVGDDNDEIETTASMRRKEYEILAASAKATKPKVLYGRVFGCEEIEFGDTKTVQAVCHLITDKRSDINTDRELRSNIYKICIPAPMLFINRKEHMGPEGYDALKKQVEMRIGSIVEFIVYDLKMDEINVLASRVNAMQILSYDYYLGRKAQIKVDTLAKGYITYVNQRGVVVDVFGAEFFIPRQEIAWKYIANPLMEEELCRVGKAVPVRIKSIKSERAQIYNMNVPYLDVTGSIKDGKENPNVTKFDKYVLGQKYSARIAYVLPTGEYICNLIDKGTEGSEDCAVCLCKPPQVQLGGTPTLHSECTVAIIDKDNKTHQMAGAITYIKA